LLGERLGFRQFNVFQVARRRFGDAQRSLQRIDEFGRGGLGRLNVLVRFVLMSVGIRGLHGSSTGARRLGSTAGVRMKLEDVAAVAIAGDSLLVLD
jgi:hypothetical protein